jgi:hypothetical protein
MKEVSFNSGSVAFGDCIDAMRRIPSRSVDLVFGSPPYEAARSYGGLTPRVGEEWVRWMFEVCVEAARISRGLCAFVIEGQAKNFDFSATPEMLTADLRRAMRCAGCSRIDSRLRGQACTCGKIMNKPAFRLRRRAIFFRHSVPGGTPDDFRNDHEFILRFTDAKIRRIEWADPTACGTEPKYRPGGRPTHQTADGRVQNAKYKPPTIAKVGNVHKISVGGGRMGSDLAHENEAPFPESLAELYVETFSRRGEVVFDPFMGSGTTAAVAIKAGRRVGGAEVREDQIDLIRRRVAEAEAMVAN